MRVLTGSTQCGQALSIKKQEITNNKTGNNSYRSTVEEGCCPGQANYYHCEKPGFTENNNQVFTEIGQFIYVCNYPMAASAISEDKTNTHFQQLSLFIVVSFRT